MRIIKVKDEILSAYENGYVICNFASLNCVMANTLSHKLKKEFREWKIEYDCRKYVAHKKDGALGTALKHGSRPVNFFRKASDHPSRYNLYSLFIKRKHYEAYSYTHLCQALRDLKFKMVLNAEVNLAILKSACVKGKDSENWLEIINVIEFIFEDTAFDIWIYD
jgi:hypothetical protein